MDDIIKKKRRPLSSVISPDADIRPDKKAREMNKDLKRFKERYKGVKQVPKKQRSNYDIGGRANLLEEMGRIDARRHPDAADRAEKRRVIGELNRGYKKGGLIKGKPKLAKRGWK